MDSANQFPEAGFGGLVESSLAMDVRPLIGRTPSLRSLIALPNSTVERVWLAPSVPLAKPGIAATAPVASRGSVRSLCWRKSGVSRGSDRPREVLPL